MERTGHRLPSDGAPNKANLILKAALALNTLLVPPSFVKSFVTFYYWPSSFVTFYYWLMVQIVVDVIIEHPIKWSA